MQNLPKDQIRKIFKEYLNQPPALDDHHKIIANLNILIQKIASDAVIAAYYPIKNEINVLELLSSSARNFALPVVMAPDEPLEFRKVDTNTNLLTGRYFDIIEPDEHASVVIPDVVIVPLLVCDRLGHRIGYGKGFYDRSLEQIRKKNPTMLAIGVCYDFQLLDKLSMQEHDQKLDIIVTDKEIFNIYSA